MSSIVEITTPQLLSVSILLRHGARGPGASEMAPFIETADVAAQWNSSDFEQLTPAGRAMIYNLGGWFARKYCPKFQVPMVSFRCSKSGRAVESGNDFVTGFNNAISRESLTVSEIPRPFSYSDEKSVDEDYFFRPWKIHKKVVDGIKSGAQNDPEFVDIALNNREFLRELFIAAGAKEDYIKNPFKCLWSTTHLYALMECEGYWHKPNERTALLSRIPMEMRRRIEELACLVWSRRFVHPCVDSVLGAPLSVEIFQQSFNRDFNMNIYSAHDYTILSVLGALDIINQLSQPSQFGCFLVFELWDRKENEMIEITEMSQKDENSGETIVLINGNESRNNGHNDGSIPVECADDNGNSGSHGINGVKGQHSNGHKSNSIHGNLGLNSINNTGGTIKHTNYTAHDNEESTLMKKSRKILKNNFLSENSNSNDNRFLRIFANFSPFTEGEYSAIDPSAAQINEENLHLLIELNIEEIKTKHNNLYESLTTRGFFSPCQNGV